MTRYQMKDKIKNIIYDSIEIGCDGEIVEVDETAEEIMKLWDQGFTWVVDKPSSS